MSNSTARSLSEKARRSSRRQPAIGALFLGLALAGGAQGESGGPTFGREIAPIVHRRCMPCHVRGGPAPFALVTFEDVKKRAGQVGEVVRTRYMPPWLPQRGYGAFAGDRSLDDGEIALIEAWVGAGAPRGEPVDPPPAPAGPGGWRLGEPDLELDTGEPYVLPAHGVDAFRHLVLRLPAGGVRHVRGVEFRFDSPRAVHHATLNLDRTGASRHLDARDPDPGFADTLVMNSTTSPDGFFVGWLPGKAPRLEDEGLAWRLDPGTNLVLEVHLQPTGKPEPVRARLGLHLAGRPPSRHPLLIRLGSETLDIPAGARDHVVEDAYRLPVDVQVLSIWPHAHYLAREISGWAQGPDGARTELIRIPDWDFNWQDQYVYRHPVELAAGTTLRARFTYDNSADNVRNPHDPPRRVLFGPRTTDEMGNLWVQVLARHPGDDFRLRAHYTRKYREVTAAGLEKTLEVREDPDQRFLAHYNLGILRVEEDRLEDAAGHFLAALDRTPTFAPARHNLGVVRARQGRLDEARSLYQETLEGDPTFARSRLNLGILASSRGESAGALEHYREAVRLEPSVALYRYSLGSLLMKLGRLDEAEPALAQAARLDPTDPDSLLNFGNLLVRRGRPAEAVPLYRQALEAVPASADLENGLGIALAHLGDGAGARDHFARAARLDPSHPQAPANLAEALDRLGERALAREVLREILRRRPGDERARTHLGRLEEGSSPPVRSPESGVRTPD